MTKTYTPAEYAQGLVAHHGIEEGRAIALEMLRETERMGREDMAYLITVEDGANFQQVMARRIFLDAETARQWGRDKRTELRGMRIAEGETDGAFVEAIDYHMTDLGLTA